MKVVHQSVKDFLVSTHLASSEHISRLAVSIQDAHMVAFEICWMYSSFEEFDHGNKVLRRDGNRVIGQSQRSNDSEPMTRFQEFAEYATSSWASHAILSGTVVLTSHRWDQTKLSILPTFRDMWLYESVRVANLLVVEFLLSSGAYPTTIGGDGSTPLHMAVSRGNQALVELLLDAGTDPEIRDEDGTTALYQAAAQENPKLYHYLLQKGARRLSTSSKVWRNIFNTTGVRPSDTDVFRGDSGIDLEFLESHLSREGRLHEVQILRIIETARDILRTEATLLDVSLPVNVCGSIHGQYYDLMKLMEVGGSPDLTNYIFLGNYVDRGYFSVECMVYLLALKIAHPQSVSLLRGVHECRRLTDYFTFHLECTAKYSERVYEAFLETFCALPLGAVVDGKFLCLHGGLSPGMHTLDDIRSVSVFSYLSSSNLISSRSTDFATHLPQA